MAVGDVKYLRVILRSIIVMIAIIAMCYTLAAVLVIRIAHPAMLLYAYVYGNRDYRDSGLLPLPFRDRIIAYEFMRRPVYDIVDFDSEDGIEFIPYTILSYGTAYHGSMPNRYKSKLETLTDKLLGRGLDINAVDHLGCTSLQNAIYFQDLRAMKFLEARGARITQAIDVMSAEPKRKHCPLENRKKPAGRQGHPSGPACSDSCESPSRGGRRG